MSIPITNDYSAGIYNNSLTNFGNILDRLIQLLKSSIEAKTEVSENLLKQLRQAEKELQQYEKQMARNKAPEIRQAIAQKTNTLMNLLQQLNRKGELSGTSGKEIKSRLAVLRSSLDELMKQNVFLENAANESNIIPGESDDNSVVA